MIAAQTHTSIERPPVVAVMGHVDHGKSTLLDSIRKTNVVDSEHGGITQHISAYEVEHQNIDGVKKKITFLDTPGHQAFSAIRTRGAMVADIAVLVVAADDGVKPQTLEALDSIKKVKIPFIVAINKIDKAGANIEMVKASLAEHEVYLEGYGGDVPFVPISALQGDGISELLNTILLVSEFQELKGNPESEAQGFVIESALDPKKGMAATLIIKNGTLRKGTFIVSGGNYCPVRFIENFAGKAIEESSFSSPVRVIGWSSLPRAGEMFTIANTKKEAEEKITEYVEQKDTTDVRSDSAGRLAIPIILKADTHGTLDAAIQEIKNITLERVYPRIIYAGLGPITEHDIQLARTKDTPLIIGFNVKVESRAMHLAEREEIVPKTFNIIYKLTEWLTEEFGKRSPTVETEETIGAAKILKIFSITRDKQVVGGRVLEGILSKGSKVKILRRENHIGDGLIKELQQHKSPISEVSEAEFGTMIESKTEIAPGDVIQSIRIVKS